MEPVLGNLDPYSGTWTRTRLCTHFVFPVLVYVLKLRSWPNIDGTYGTLYCYATPLPVFTQKDSTVCS